MTMTNMWSKNKYVELIIDLLIFLLSLNILHIGQLLLPIICLIIFIDNKMEFKVNNIKTFTVLCFFGVLFCAFSYNLGFYCVMGFCLPMAYYIGSNMKNCNEENLKKLFFIIMLGMSIHVVLNFAYDFSRYGIETFRKNNHYDIWLKDIVQQAILSADCLFCLGSIYYYLKYEKNKNYRLTSVVLFTIIFIYNIALGRRTPLFIIVVAFLFRYSLILFSLEAMMKIRNY